jgi:CheY-like chemotaxis protein
MAAKKILVVDDEADIVTYLKTLFEDNGYAVIAAVNGVEAMEKTKKEAPDLITLDMSMPEQSGVRTYRDLKDDATLKKIPVIMITGVTGGFKDFIHGRKQVPPPEGFIQKPIDAVELIKMVKGLIG